MTFDALASGWAKALSVDRKQFNMFFEKMMDGFAYHKIVVDKTGKPVDYVFLECNKAFEKMTGLKRVKIIGKKVTEVLKGIENDPADWIGIYGKVALSGKPAQFENYSQPLDRWYNVSAYSPEKGYFVALFEDITTHKKAEEEIARLATFPELNPNPIVEVDFDCKVQYVNPAAKAMFSEDLGSSCHPLFADLEKIVQKLRRGEERSLSREVKVGESTFYQNIHLVSNANRVRFYAVNIDSLKRAENALRESEQNYRHLLLYAPTAIYEIDYEGPRFKSVNDAMCQMTGYSREELLSMSPTDLLDFESRRRFLERIKKGLAGQKMDNNVEYKAITKDGHELWVVLNVNLNYKNGKLDSALVVGYDITERKKAEQGLSKAKTDWERTFDSVPDLIVILDNHHTILRANRAFANQLRVTPEQAIGLKCHKCVHGTELPPEFCPHAKTVEDGKEHVAEIHEPRLGGDFLVSTTPLKDAEGKIIGSVHVARNITDSKKAEDTLRKLNRHLRAVSNSTQALMHATDETEYTQEICDIIVKDCGYALVWVGFAEQDEAKNVRPIAFAGFDKSYIDSLNVTWDENSERGRGPTGTVIRTGKAYVCRNMSGDPNFKPWRAQATQRGYTASLVLPLLLIDGQTFGALNVYSRESDPFSEDEINLLTELANDFAYGITMLRLRKEREQTEQTMRKQASLIDLSPDAIIVRKMDGEISLWSAGAETLYGWTKNEAIGKPIQDLLKFKLSEPLNDIIDVLKKKGKWSRELIHETKDGRTLVVQSYWLPKFDENNEVSELMESNVDITDRKQMQTKLEEYAAHLEELVQERTQQLKDAERLTAIGETAGMVGHDLRNPLQTVAGETFLAKDELKNIPDSPAKRNLEENVNIISEQISYMDKIVSDLQDFVRPITPDKKSVDLQKLLIATLAQVSLTENIETETKIDKSLPQISADSQLLRRVFFNLFTNAVQAMPNGGKLTVKAQAKKSTKENDKAIIIHVKDTGVGIPESVKPKIFRPLFTTKSKGQGFGLAVCQRVIEAHGGTITFKSQEGKGTQFTVELPI